MILCMVRALIESCILKRSQMIMTTKLNMLGSEHDVTG